MELAGEDLPCLSGRLKPLAQVQERHYTETERERERVALTWQWLERQQRQRVFLYSIWIISPNPMSSAYFLRCVFDATQRQSNAKHNHERRDFILILVL